ncbi:MAG: NAD(P)-dependent oxidoreductase [Chloroflexi bacterium]|nr:NAD(P)-dependent oxidoreductase [Chloroflexota bacterium]
MRRVGVIGLGNMGRPIARNIVRGGYEVVVYDLNAAAVQSLVDEGATAASRPADVAAGADLVITVLPDGPDVLQAMLGEEGVYHAAREGMIHADFSTVHPNISRTLAEAGRTRGIRVLDTAMTRSVPQAEAGTLGLLVGGAAEDLDACRPIFEKIASTIHHCGPNGAGATMKLVNNMLASTIAAATVEALLLGVKAGLTPELMLSVLGTTAANNGSLEPAIRGRILKRQIERPVFALNLQYKDVRLALEMASDVGAAVPVSAIVQQLRGVARAKGRGGWDSSAITTVFEELDDAVLTATEPSASEV